MLVGHALGLLNKGRKSALDGSAEIGMIAALVFRLRAVVDTKGGLSVCSFKILA